MQHRKVGEAGEHVVHTLFDLQPSLYPYCAGVPPTPTTVSAEHDYAKGTSNRPLAPSKTTPGYSTLAITGGKDHCVRLDPVEESSSATTSATASTTTSSTTRIWAKHQFALFYPIRLLELV